MKIASTIMSMCLALMVMGFAVWAASTQTMPVTNTVDFTSIHVLSTVTGTVTGAKTDTFTNYGPVSTLAGDPEGKLGTWAIGSAMEFANETEPVVITLTVVNNSDERSLSFELSGESYGAFNGTNLGDTNIDRTCVYSIDNATPITNATYTSGAINVEALKTATIVMTLDISDNGKSVTAFDNSFSTTLRNIGESAPVEGFSFDTGSGEIATLSTSEPLLEENIPELFVEGQPAFYGLYSDSDFTQEIEFPYSGSSTIFAKFGNPTDMVFTDIGNNEYSVSKSGTPTGTLVIPKKYNWKSVTTIPNSAFYGCSEITNIIVPDSITSFGSTAFYGTTWLNNQPSGVVIYLGKVVYGALGSLNNTSVTIAEGTRVIAANAFFGKSTMTSVTIPESVISIGNDAFHGCYNLTSISIPGSAVYLGTNVLTGCSALTSLSAPFVAPYSATTNSYYKYYFGGTSYNSSITLPNISTVTITNDATDISDYAFWNISTMITANIPESVTTIGYSTFSNCSNLQNITFPNGLTTIGTTAFSSCLDLVNLVIPDSVTNIGNFAFNNTAWYNSKPNSTLIYAGKVAYKYKGSMPTNTNLTLIEGTKGIACSAFESFINLKSITINSTVEYIGELAFKGCTGLTGVTIPSSVSIIGGSAFEGCTGLTSVTTSEGLTKIGYMAFTGCSNITSISLPNTLTEIEGSAFQSCTKLSTITIASSISKVGSLAFNNTLWYTNQPDGMVYVGTVAYSYKGLMPASTTINLRSDTTCLTDNLFDNMGGLVAITLPETLTYIGTGAFDTCRNLTSITIPKNVSYIGITNFNFSENMTSISVDPLNTTYKSVDGVLYNFEVTQLIACPAGKTGTLTIPSTVKDILVFSVEYCEKLTSIVIPASVETIANMTVDNYHRGIGENSLLQSIIVDANNQYFKSIDGVLFNKLGTDLLYFPTAKAGSSYTIPDGVTKVEQQAFENVSFTELHIPASVTTFKAFEFDTPENPLTVFVSSESLVTNVSYGNSVRYLYNVSSLINVHNTLAPSGEYFEVQDIVVGTHYEDGSWIEDWQFIEDGPDGLCDDQSYMNDGFVDEDTDGYDDNNGSTDIGHWEDCGYFEQIEVEDIESAYKYFEPSTTNGDFETWSKVTTDYGQW